jgi:hypothetical protein
MSAVRRLAAIVAVDFMGYSRLMGEDEAGTVRWFMNIARRRCSRHARSEMPRQDSQVTVDGRLGVPEPTRAASESPESLRIDFGRWTTCEHSGG